MWDNAFALECGKGLLHEHVSGDAYHDADDQRPKPPGGCAIHHPIQRDGEPDARSRDERQKACVQNRSAHGQVSDVSTDGRDLFGHLGFGQLDFLPQQRSRFVGQVFEERADRSVVNVCMPDHGSSQLTEAPVDPPEGSVIPWEVAGL